MAEHVDRVNMNSRLCLGNTFSVKVEEYRGNSDSFIDDKMCISETAISTDNAELESPIRHIKIKEYEDSTCLDNIKIELTSFEMTEVQNDNVKIGGEVCTDDIKIESDNGLLYCEHCEAYYVDYCIECGMLVNILNKNAVNSSDSRTRKDIPNDILEIQDYFGHTGIYALRIIPAGVKFGPFTGLATTECPWDMKRGKFILNRNKLEYLNWMQYVNPTRNTCDGNMHVLQSEDNLYYQSSCSIQAGEELLVYFGDEYGNNLNENVIGDFVFTSKDISEEIFACTFCCLGFSSKSHLAKHKTVCVENAAGKFSIEELTQCSFCKIHLDPTEYFEHHMTFCCERNARKGILPTPPSKQATTALHGRKRCLRQTYKCAQCKFRTKYQADLKKHHKQHYDIKMYKCGICNRRFKTKESLRLHLENTHAFVEGKDDQEHWTTDYSNTFIKVKQLRSRDKNKIFKCSLCIFRSKYKHSLRIHTKTKHLNQFDYKCDSCEFGTNHKGNLEYHTKTKHLREFDFKCDSCEFGTNRKDYLEYHIKTKHWKEFDYKCDFCDFGANIKNHLEYHIKSKHLKLFDYKCNTCDFETNIKTDLKRHIKTTHLKEFDYKCDSCEFRTNRKGNLERHIKSKHLKRLDFKCDSCEFGTKTENRLEYHIKTTHLKQFCYKCDTCDFGTNRKNNLKYHIKTKHLKEFDYKCDTCEFGTNTKNHLEIHIKTTHLKEFDYKCDNCKYRTNKNSDFKNHIKAKHSKEVYFKCDFCVYGTNSKQKLEIHIKSKHLMIFDIKCDSCPYGTNHKRNLEYHIKTKHLKNLITNVTHVYSEQT